MNNVKIEGDILKDVCTIPKFLSWKITFSLKMQKDIYDASTSFFLKIERPHVTHFVIYVRILGQLCV